MRPSILYSIFLSFLLFISLKSSSAQPSPFGHKIQYIGNNRYVSHAEEQNRNWCETFWCTNDAFYIFTKSSQYPDVDPCVDFKNFTVNQAEEVDVVDDRVPYRGFQMMVYNKYREQLRKIMAEKFNPTKDKNNRIVKVLKNAYRQCLKSPHVFRHLQAHEDIIEHLSRLGGSPYLSKHINFNPRKFNASEDYRIGCCPGKIDGDDLWNESQWDFKKIMEEEPMQALNLIDYQVKRCTHPENVEIEILCFERFNGWKWNNQSFENFKDFFFDLEDSYVVAPQLKQLLVDKIIIPAMENLKNFLKMKSEIIQKKFPKYSFITIKDLNENLEKYFNIDWLKVINSYLLTNSNVNENETILIDGGIDLLHELIKNLFQMKKE